jgi:hypothetical protein
MNLPRGLGNSAVTESQNHIFYKYFIYPERPKNSSSAWGINYFQNNIKSHKPIQQLRKLAFFYILYKT